MYLHHSYNGPQYSRTAVQCEGRPTARALRAADSGWRVDLQRFKRANRCTFKVLVHEPTGYAYLTAIREGSAWLHKGVDLAHKDIQVLGVWVWS